MKRDRRFFYCSEENTFKEVTVFFIKNTIIYKQLLRKLILNQAELRYEKGVKRYNIYVLVGNIYYTLDTDYLYKKLGIKIIKSKSSITLVYDKFHLKIKP